MSIEKILEKDQIRLESNQQDMNSERRSYLEIGDHSSNRTL